MRSFLLIVLAVLLATLIAARIFESGFTRGVETATKTTSPATPIFERAASTSSPVTVFHGPTAEPQIIGPRGNPPNY